MSPTDESEQPFVPASPADEAAVARLLADARETGPVPAEVAARLDTTLAGLVAERGAVPLDAQRPAPTAAVVSLHRRRRLRAGALLAAAAAVIAGGMVFGQLDTGGSDGDQAASESAPDRPSDVAGGAEAEDNTQLNKGNDRKAEDVAPPTDTALAADPARLHTRHLVADLARLRETLDAQLTGADYTTLTVSEFPQGFMCRPKKVDGDGFVLPARYDDRPALVVFREPVGHSQVADVVQCGTGEVLRSATIPLD
jgi:hypothetical protein